VTEIVPQVQAERLDFTRLPSTNLAKISVASVAIVTLKLLLRGRLSEERIFVERAEAALFRIHTPAPPHNTQAGHHRDGKVNPEHAGNFASCQHAKNCRQRM